MFQLLSICCFVVIVWILVSDPEFGDTKSRKSDEGNNTFLSALIGILISPFLLIGALLVFLLKLLGSAIPFLLFVASSLVQGLRNLCSMAYSIVGRMWRSLESFGRFLSQSGLSFRAVRSLLRDVRLGLDTFADVVRASVRAVTAFLMRLVTAVHSALQRFFGWIRDTVSACMRVLRRIAHRLSDNVRSFLTTARQTSARSPSDSVQASSRSIRRHQTSRQWFAWLFPFAGRFSRSSRDGEEEEERRWKASRRKGSVHAVHGDRFSRRKKHVAGFYVGQIAQDQMKIQKVLLNEEDGSMVLPRIRQIGWQTRGRARHLS